MKLKTFIIDAFTSEPFRGNPAGVCLLEQQLEKETMQEIAGEINLSETAFLSRVTDEEYTIRYFTPTVEIAFCGHATLASAKLLFDRKNLSKVNFTTHHGLKLSAEKENDRIVMAFPLYPTIPYDAKQELLDAVGIKQPLSVQFSDELKTVLVEVADTEALMALQPDFSKALAATADLRLFVVTAKSIDGIHDFHSRCFCPWIGIDEDPVTGATHTLLARYWGDKLGKTELNAYQASARGGHMQLNITGSDTLEIRCDARIILEGMMEW